LHYDTLKDIRYLHSYVKLIVHCSRAGVGSKSTIRGASWSVGLHFYSSSSKLLNLFSLYLSVSTNSVYAKGTLTLKSEFSIQHSEGRKIKIAESRAKFHKFRQRIALVCTKNSEKFFQNSFLLKFHVGISTEFGTKHNKFRVKRMSIHSRKKSNSFTHKRTFLSPLAMINKKFIVSLVGRIWSSNLSQNSTDSMTNVWSKFQTKTPKE